MSLIKPLWRSLGLLHREHWGCRGVLCACVCVHTRVCKYVHGCTHVRVHVYTPHLLGWWFIEHSLWMNQQLWSHVPFSVSKQAPLLGSVLFTQSDSLVRASGFEDRLWDHSFSSLMFSIIITVFITHMALVLTNKPMLRPTSLAGQTRISFSKWIDDISKSMLTNPFPVRERFPDCRQIHWRRLK